MAGRTAPRRTPRTVVGAYVALTKPRIIELLLITTVPTMVLAADGWPPLRLVLVTLVGGTLAAGGANAINMYVDRDIDALMQRTQRAGRWSPAIIAPRNALVFALVLEVVAFAVLWAGANLLSALLALGAAAFYVGVYTLWLKRTSTHNIVIGGAAGAVPVLVGWAAVTGLAGLGADRAVRRHVLWTPPHFWALAIRYADDYRAADVPMLPAVAPIVEAARQMIVYTAAWSSPRSCWSRSPTSAGSTRSPPSCSAPGSSWRRSPSPATRRRREHAGVHVQHHATSRSCSPRSPSTCSWGEMRGRVRCRGRVRVGA